MSTARRDQSDGGIRAPETGESVALEKTKSAKDETVSEAETSYRHTVLDDGGGQGIYWACFREGRQAGTEESVKRGLISQQE